MMRHLDYFMLSAAARDKQISPGNAVWTEWGEARLHPRPSLALSIPEQHVRPFANEVLLLFECLSLVVFASPLDAVGILVCWAGVVMPPGRVLTARGRSNIAKVSKIRGFN